MSTERRSDRVATLREILKRHRDNIAKLEKRRAEYGLDVPLKLENELENERKRAKEVEAQIERIMAGNGDLIHPDMVVDRRSTSQKLERGDIAKGGIIGVTLTALICAIGAIIASYFGYLRVASPGQLKATKEVILSEHAEIFDFDDGDTSGWKPFEWDDGWVFFEKSGNIEVVGRDFVLDGHSGPFLKYPLDLQSERRHHYLNRNAIYKPVDEKVTGILANIFYESEEEYSFEEIHAGFVVPYQVGSEELMVENYMKKLIPNRWNTIVWSSYGPVWWNAEDKDKKWEEFKELFGDQGASMHPGLRLDHNKIGSIGIQFYVYTEDGSREFKGTAYIDNIALIYTSTTAPTNTPFPPTTTPTFTPAPDEAEMVHVPAGEFIMGSDPSVDEYTEDDEQPVHTVYLDAFYIDETEVTNAQFAAFVSATDYETDAEQTGCGWIHEGDELKCVPGVDWQHPFGPDTGVAGKDEHPVVRVSWNDAKAYCEWAGARLPTEAEWEKAARGTDGRTYPWGNTFDGSWVNFCDQNCEFDWKDTGADDGYAQTAPVGSYPAGASPHGALDMAGNVWEWVADWYGDGYYATSPETNPKGPASGGCRVIRDGSWRDSKAYVRTANRGWGASGDAFDYVGFRCAR